MGIRIRLVYACPSPEEAFVARLRACAAAHGVELCELASASRSSTQPTTMVVRDGEVVGVAVGAVSRRELDDILDHAWLAA